MKYLGLLFIWMKYYHITKNSLIYEKVKNINTKIVKYSWFFYLLKVLYPIWIAIGLFSGHIIYAFLLGMGLVKYFIYPLIKGKTYKYYELTEALVSIVLYIVLLWH